MKNFSDWRPAPNIGAHPDTYELENEAIARDGRLDEALRELAGWSGATLLDIGCGTGFWLPRYAADAARVVGVEPDPDLLRRARERVADLPNVEAIAGSAEQLPLPDDSVDVVHARFAYFFGAGCEPGLNEVRRVLSRGGVFVAVDNCWEGGAFASLLELSTTGNAAIDPAATAAFWTRQGATRHRVEAAWQCRSVDELEAILRIEFPGAVVDEFLADHHDGAPRLTYDYVLHRFAR